MITTALRAVVKAAANVVAPILSLTDEERAKRAELLAGLWSPTIWYWIDPDHNGGRDPRARDCATHWKDGNRVAWATSDCVGFVSWAIGFRRRLKTFPIYSGAINTDSMLMDARDKQRHFRETKARRGCIITMPGVFDPVTKKRLRPGHTGVVTYVDPRFDPLKPDLSLIKVAHCSPKHHKPYGQAIAITDGKIFGTRVGWMFLEFVP